MYNILSFLMVSRPGSFYGGPLGELLLYERRCSHAHLNPLLGIPTQAIKMINFIASHANTPNLFRQHAVVG